MVSLGMDFLQNMSFLELILSDFAHLPLLVDQEFVLGSALGDFLAFG